MRSRLLTFALVLGVGCGSPKPDAAEQGAPRGAVSAIRTDVGDSIGTVNGAPLPVEDFMAAANRHQPASGGEFSDADRRSIVDELVQDEVLFQEALKRGLFHDSKVRKILVNMLIREEIHAQVKSETISDDELRAYYDERRDDFVMPEKVQVRRILLRIREDRNDAATKAEAQRLYEEVKRDPRVFTAVAKKHSNGTYSRRGGDLGFVSREGKPGVEPEVIAKAFDLKREQITPPFKVGDAYHILQLVDRREKSERSFDQMKGSVLRMVKQDRHEALRAKYIEQLRSSANIAIDQGKVDAIELRARPTRGAHGADGHSHGPGDDHGHDH